MKRRSKYIKRLTAANASHGNKADTIITYIALIIISFIFLFPCLWLILASFSRSGDIYSFDGFFPTSFSLDSFKTLFTDTKLYNYPLWFRNTLFISTFTCIFSTILVLMTAYVMSRFQFKSRKKLMRTTLILGMFPSFMSIIAMFLIVSKLKLINNPWSLILIYSAAAPMAYLTQKGFFDTIQISIDEAARIDGASYFKIFTRVHLPISKPIFVYTALTSFTWPWSDYILPRLMLNTKDTWTVAQGLMELDDTEFSRFAAGSVFIAVPIIIVYFCLAKYLVGGITAGSDK